MSGGQDPSATTPTPGASSRSADVLVVDDYPDARDMVVIILESAGFTARAAASGAAALTLARERRPDAVFLDIYMPDMDGVDTARRFKGDAELRNVPLIAYTARADTLGLPAELFAALCAKPCPPEKLVALVDAVTAIGGPGQT